ncbi:CHASE domain-containing protein [Desulfurispira natronophila]|uniref:histidine kinase n=1 Tax=Desulfurispira natronophila TaxID=682562 RepID=A0A7W7Y2S7_9BACT|nr:CHASE domain-containing protein [Desulfurispira natronophila]MBB5021035.1 PAS domain S-box-containing protein [Desulfurispira natronophila]
MSHGSILTRRLAWLSTLIALLLLGFLLALFLVEKFNNQRYLDHQRDRVHEKLQQIRHQFETDILSHSMLVQGLASVIAANPHIDQDEFTQAASPLFYDHTLLRNIAAAPDLVIRFVYPMEGNEAAVGLDYRTTPEQFTTVLHAIEVGQPTLAGPVELVQGGVGFITRIPVNLDKNNGESKLWGMISAAIDAKALYRNSGLLHPDTDVNIALRGADGTGAHGNIFWGSPDVFKANPVLATVRLPYGHWQLAATPTDGWSHVPPNLWYIRSAYLLLTVLITLPLILLLRSTRTIIFAQKQTEQVATQLQTLIDNFPDIIWLTDTNGRFLTCNARFLELLDISEDEIVGKNESEFNSSTLPCWVKPSTSFTTQESKAKEVSLRCPHSNQQLLYSIVHIQIWDKSNQSIGILGIGHDITTHKMQEDFLQKRIDNAVSEIQERDTIIAEQHRQQSISRLIMNLAHQWRQPLNVIGLLVQEIDLERTEQGTSQKIHTNCEEIMEELLYLSRTIDHLTQLYKSSDDVCTISLQNVYQEAQELLQQHTAFSYVNFVNGLTPELSLQAYRSDWIEIFLSLLENALDAAERNFESNQSTTITIGGETLHNGVRLTITDNAGGIAPDLLHTIFDPYVTTSFQSRQKGLGLYTVRRILRNRYHGDITVENTRCGAKFTLEAYNIKQAS